MLRPQNSPTREMVNLDGTWRLAVDWDRTGLTDNWQNRPLSGRLEARYPGPSMIYSMTSESVITWASTGTNVKCGCLGAGTESEFSFVWNQLPTRAWFS